MSCTQTAFSFSAWRLAWQLLLSPFALASLALRHALTALLSLPPTQTGFRPARNYLPLSPYLMSSQGPAEALTDPSDDDFDPEFDEWALWLDDPYVARSCIPHLTRCHALDCSKHSHP